MALPGIGRYTAGAILSISRDVRLPILEGNTQRVFSRWVAFRGSATEPPANRLLWQIAEAMLPRKHPGAFNQAAMELGALVCGPKQPDCDRCPGCQHVPRPDSRTAAGDSGKGIPGQPTKIEPNLRWSVSEARSAATQRSGTCCVRGGGSSMGWTVGFSSNHRRFLCRPRLRPRFICPMKWELEFPREYV